MLVQLPQAGDPSSTRAGELPARVGSPQRAEIIDQQGKSEGAH